MFWFGILLRVSKKKIVDGNILPVNGQFIHECYVTYNYLKPLRGGIKIVTIYTCKNL